MQRHNCPLGPVDNGRPGGKGSTGATGASGPGLPPGVTYSDYLFWDPNSGPEGAWQVGSESVHVGANAGSSGQTFGSVARKSVV